VSAFISIVKQTIKASVRSRVFHILAGALLLAVLGLPLTVEGPGTAVGELQVAIRYPMSAVILLVSLSSLWLGCANLPREIETYRMHLVRTKPVPPWVIWVSKWCAVFLIHAVLFILAAAVVFGLIRWRVASKDFTEKQLKRLEEEVLVGRRTYTPRRPELWKAAEEEYQELKEEGELSADHNPQVIKRKLFREKKFQATEVRPNHEHVWVYDNVKTPPGGDSIYCRYRLYIGSPEKISKDETAQRLTRGVWGVGAPGKPPERTFYRQDKGGAFKKMRIPAGYVSEDNRLALRYLNLDPGREPVVFQLKDGPKLLVPVASFGGNYVRASVMVLIQLAFLAALGCAAGAAFSTPVAVFVGVAYLVMGMAVGPILERAEKSRVAPGEERSAAQTYVESLAVVVQHVVVSLDEYQTTGKLVDGRLISAELIGRGLLQLLILRGVVLASLGMYVLTRRELGRVMRT